MDKQIEKILLNTKEIETSFKKIEDLLTYPEVMIDKTFYKYLISKQNKIRKAYDIRCAIQENSTSNLEELIDSLNRELVLLGDDGTPGAKLTISGDKVCINHILKSVYDIINKNAFELKEQDNSNILVYGLGAYTLFKEHIGLHKFSGNPKGEVKLFVTPLEEIETFSIDDVEINLFHSDGAGGQNVNKVETGVRAIHKPTKLFVTCKDERSQLQNKNRAIENLEAKVNTYYKDLQEKKESELIKKQCKNIRIFEYIDGRKEL